MSVTGLFRLLQKALASRGAVVFNLHRVLPEAEAVGCYNPNLVLDPKSLDSFVTFLKSRLPVVPVAEIVEMKLKGKPKPCAALTFDDGWGDNYRVAFPILAPHNVPFTIFLPTEMTGIC